MSTTHRFTVPEENVFNLLRAVLRNDRMNHIACVRLAWSNTVSLQSAFVVHWPERKNPRGDRSERGCGHQFAVLSHQSIYSAKPLPEDSGVQMGNIVSRFENQKRFPEDRSTWEAKQAVKRTCNKMRLRSLTGSKVKANGAHKWGGTLVNVSARTQWEWLHNWR